MIRTLLVLSLFAFPACKKKPPEVTPTVTPETPTQVPEAPKAEVPDSVQQMMKNFERVFFELDSHTLSDDAKQALAENAEIMQSSTDIKVEVQGHADERGTTDYNLALGQRRADSVQARMVSAGVSAERITTVSYGEERPVEDRSDEAAWAANRRAEIRAEE